MSSELILSLVLIGAGYPAAWATARLLQRWVPAIARELRVDASQRQLSLDGLRGVLSVSVFCYHAVLTRNFLQTGHWVPASTYFTNELGQASVALFFMITSFLFWGRVLDTGARMKWGRFYLSRIFRLTPLYVVAVVVLTGLVLIRSGGQLLESKRMFVTHLADWLFFTVRLGPDINLVQNTWQIIAGVTWSLRYEWLFYFALPLLSVVVTGLRQWKAALISLALIALMGRLTRFDPLSFTVSRAFLGGIVAAHWIRAEKLRALGAQSAFGGFALVCLAIVMVANVGGYGGWSLGLLTVFLVAVACDNRLFGFLRGAAVRWLGEVSYGIYLLHGFFLWVATRHVLPVFLNPQQLDDRWFCGIALALAPLLVLVTSALNLWVERPGIALGRKVGDWWESASAVRAPAPVVEGKPVFDRSR